MPCYLQGIYINYLMGLAAACFVAAFAGHGFGVRVYPALADYFVAACYSVALAACFHAEGLA